jgi:DNA polymerase-3 subunit beta
MIFECLQEYLNKGLGTVVRAVPVKGSLPVLSNVLITAESGKVKLTATNLDTVISVVFGASIQEEGSVTVPAKMFHEFVSNLQPGKLLISSDKNILNITSFPKSKAKFNGMSSIEFPEIPSVKESNSYLKISPKVLTNLVSHTHFSSCPDVTRPVLTGTLISFSNGKLSFVTTDGFRLSEKSVAIEGDFKEFNVVAPTKTLLDISKIFSGGDDLLSVIFNQDDNLLFFQSGDTTVAARVIDGVYPDHKRIIPTTSTFKAQLNSSELLNAVKLTNVFSKEANSPIKIEFSDDGIVKVYSNSQDTGENVSEFEAVVEGGPLTTSFNSKYINDFLNNIKAETVSIESNGGVTPAVFRSTQSEDFLHIIMPMKN